MSLHIKRKINRDFAIIKLSGEATSEEVSKLSKAIEESRVKGFRKIAVDVAETVFLDSSALGVLILNYKMLSKENGDLCLLSPTLYIRDLLRNSNLDTVFRLVDSEEDL